MEAHCVNLELKYQNQVLKEGQRGQFLKVKSNEAKVKHDIDVTETINIELEHKVTKLLNENETLKKHYKDLYDSIKTTRAKHIEHTTSLIANNDNFKAQLQEKGFAIAALKMIKESAVAKPHHMIAPGSSRYSSNDMIHNHYLEEAKKKTQESSRNLEPSVLPSVRSQSTTNGSKPKPKINNQNSKNWPTSKIGLRWVPTGKIFASSTNKVDSEPTNGSKDDITNQYECEQTLDVSAGTLNLSAGTSFNPKKEGLRVCSELGIHDHNNEPSSSKLVPKVVPQADKTATSRQELELLFHHHITMLRSTLLEDLTLKSWKSCQGDSSKLNLPDHRLYGDEAMILKESLMMLLVSNVMEFGVDVTDNNRICYTVHRKEAATDSLNIYCDQDKKQQMKKIRVLLTLLLGSKYLFKYCCAGWIKISVIFDLWLEHVLLSLTLGSMEMWWWWDVVGVVEMKMKVVAARGGDGVAVTMVLVVYCTTMGMAVVVCDKDGGDEGGEMMMMTSVAGEDEGELAFRLAAAVG
ncbi:hypothetical protein Tco_1482603 [Tanacetum coccineum]